MFHGQTSNPMRKTILLFSLLLILALPALCRADVTFKVEELSKPKALLSTRSQAEIFKALIRADAGFDINRPPENDAVFPYGIVAQSKSAGELAGYFGYHSFIYGMKWAYAEHRPFVLSPDMIWLLISQGFAKHVNANPEKLRSQFADYSGKMSLVVTSTDVRLDDPNAPWETVFPQFTRQIAKNAGGGLVETLSADFSTTTPVEKIASDITLMEATKSYFDYITVSSFCGIPEITLQGTPEDWQKVLDKTRQLSKYDLAWWTDELEPILEEFVRASQGKADTAFWRNIYHKREDGMCGDPDTIDGWIIKFFPYDNDGNRNDLKTLHRSPDWNLPNEIVKVDMSYVDLQANTTTPLELWAGFAGLEQNPKTYALTPKIAWMIRKADTSNLALKQSLSPDDKNATLIIRVKEIPPEILGMKQIRSLSVTFFDKIIIPDQMAGMQIKHLWLDGKIDVEGIKRIKAMFPKTYLFINDEQQSFDPDDPDASMTIRVKEVPPDILAIKRIRELDITFEDKINIPDQMAGMQITYLYLRGKIDAEGINRIKSMFPKTTVYINGKGI